MTYDEFMTALTVWREARGTSAAARAGVLHVILTRTRTRNRSACSVVTQPAQFSCFLSADPNATKFPLPSNAADWKAWQEICDMVANPPADPTGGATHYFSPMPNGPPRWADPQRFTVAIAPFTFFKLEG